MMYVTSFTAVAGVVVYVGTCRHVWCRYVLQVDQLSIHMPIYAYMIQYNLTYSTLPTSYNASSSSRWCWWCWWWRRVMMKQHLAGLQSSDWAGATTQPSDWAIERLAGWPRSMYMGCWWWWWWPCIYLYLTFRAEKPGWRKKKKQRNLFAGFFLFFFIYSTS
jgi:hypothetical protein